MHWSFWILLIGLGGIAVGLGLIGRGSFLWIRWRENNTFPDQDHLRLVSAIRYNEELKEMEVDYVLVRFTQRRGLFARERAYPFREVNIRRKRDVEERRLKVFGGDSGGPLGSGAEPAEGTDEAS